MTARTTGTAATVAALLDVLDDAAELMTAAIVDEWAGAQARAALERIERAREILGARDWVGAGGEDGYREALPEDLLHAPAPISTAIPVDLVSACLARAHGPLRLLVDAGDAGPEAAVVCNTLWSTDDWIETTRRLLERIDVGDGLERAA